MRYQSFIDVLFILLLSAIVMLAQSFQVGALELAPAKVGVGGVSPVHADEVRLVIVMDDALLVDEQVYASAAALHEAEAPGAPILLVARRADVSHQRVMTTWSELKALGRDVRLGVEPTDAPAPPPPMQGGAREGA